MVYALTIDNRKGTLQNRELFVNNVTKRNLDQLIVSSALMGTAAFHQQEQ